MKVNCANAGLIFFLADKSTPTCLFLHTDYHYPYDFMSPECRYMRFLYFYCHVLWLLLFVNFWRFDQFYKVFSPHNKKEKKEKKNKNKKTKPLNPWIDLVNLKVLFLRNSKELDFLCDCSNGVCLPNVLKNMFIMLFP